MVFSSSFFVSRNRNLSWLLPMLLKKVIGLIPENAESMIMDLECVSALSNVAMVLDVSGF